MRILLAAEESAGARCLLAVRKSGHDLLGVLTSSSEGTVGREAARHGTPLLDARLLKDPAFAAEVRSMHADVLLNVHSLYLIKPSILEAFSFGCFNLHPGPLPDYAGMNAPSWAILNGESRHGVTLHWMSAGIDEGLIAYQELFDLSEKDTGFSVSMRCITLGLDMLNRLLETLSRDPGAVPRVAQDLSRRRYFGREKPFGGRVPATMTAAELARFVRASDYSPFASPWGHPVVAIDGRAVALVNVRETGVAADSPAGALAARDGEAWLAAADQWVALRRVAVDGKQADPLTLVGTGE
jgi:methionyl-tRNA formyltransferase